MSKHELYTQPLSSIRQAITIGLTVLGLTLFLVFGAIGASKANDKKVVEGEPRYVASKGAAELANSKTQLSTSTYAVLERKVIPAQQQIVVHDQIEESPKEEKTNKKQEVNKSSENKDNRRVR